MEEAFFVQGCSANYDDPLRAELYDRSGMYTDDVTLIRKLIALVTHHQARDLARKEPIE